MSRDSGIRALSCLSFEFIRSHSSASFSTKTFDNVGPVPGQVVIGKGSNPSMKVTPLKDLGGENPGGETGCASPLQVAEKCATVQRESQESEESARRLEEPMAKLQEPAPGGRK